MIKIKFTYENGFTNPERELTEEEIKSVTSILSNGATMEIIYYQGDEPVVKQEPVDEKGMDISQVDITTLTSDQLNTLAELLRSKL